MIIHILIVLNCQIYRRK